MARERPNLPILAVTVSETVARRLGIVWGVKGTVCKGMFTDFAKLENVALSAARYNKVGKKGDYLIVTAGYPIGNRGKTNLLHTVQI